MKQIAELQKIRNRKLLTTGKYNDTIVTLDLLIIDKQKESKDDK